MSKQQSPETDAGKKKNPDQQLTSDTIKNAHAVGDGALEKTDMLIPVAEEVKEQLKAEELEKGAEKY